MPSLLRAIALRRRCELFIDREEVARLFVERAVDEAFERDVVDARQRVRGEDQIRARCSLLLDRKSTRLNSSH